ncbi:MAG: hypothetical protein ACYSR9_06935 [Planctomycetota bacterium]|jgi:hypothetical protein
MKVSRIIVSVILIVSSFSLISGWYKESFAKSPSVFDLPDKGLYYGFIVNNSSHFIEVEIWSEKQKVRVGPKRVLPPARSAFKDNASFLKYWNNKKYSYRPSNVYPLWLKLDRYKVTIRERDDVIGAGIPGESKEFIVILDKNTVEKSPGPFTFEIEDE